MLENKIKLTGRHHRDIIDGIHNASPGRSDRLALGRSGTFLKLIAYGFEDGDNAEHMPAMRLARYFEYGEYLQGHSLLSSTPAAA